MSNTFNFLDELGSEGIRGFFNKDSQIGDSVTGTILDAFQRQTTDYVSKKPEFWDDGNPKIQVIIKIKTGLCEDADDNGERAIYVKTWGAQWAALKDAVRATGATRTSEAVRVGATFTATLTGTQPSKAGLSPTKIYEYRIIPATTANLDNIPAAPAPAVAPAPAPAAPAPAPAPQMAAQVAQAPQTPTPQVAPAAAAPVAAPAPAPVAAEPDPATKARQLIGLGVDDQSIANTTGLGVDVIATIRANM